MTFIKDLLIAFDNLPIPTEQQLLERWGNYEKPLVSIRCIAFNHAKYIENTLKGFLIQKTDFPFEIIIHDDASTDGTAEIIKSYRDRYPSIIKAVLQTENQYSKGRRASEFINQLINGKYTAGCEGDDFWLDPLKLQKQIHFLETNPEYVISGHDACVMNEAGEIVQNSKLLNEYRKDFSGDELVKGKAFLLTMSWVYRNVIEGIAPERLKVVNADIFLISMLGLHGKSKYHDDIAPAVYRVHPGGVWSSLNEVRRIDSHINTYYWMYKYFQRIGQKSYAQFYLKKMVQRALENMDTIAVLSMSFVIVKVLIKKCIGKAIVERLRSLKSFFQ